MPARFVKKDGGHDGPQTDPWVLVPFAPTATAQVDLVGGAGYRLGCDNPRVKVTEEPYGQLRRIRVNGFERPSVVQLTATSATGHSTSVSIAALQHWKVKTACFRLVDKSGRRSFLRGEATKEGMNRTANALIAQANKILLAQTNVELAETVKPSELTWDKELQDGKLLYWEWSAEERRLFKEWLKQQIGPAKACFNVVFVPEIRDLKEAKEAFTWPEDGLCIYHELPSIDAYQNAWRLAHEAAHFLVGHREHSAQADELLYSDWQTATGAKVSRDDALGINATAAKLNGSGGQPLK